MTEKLYSGLPAVLVDDYEEVTESRLNSELKRVRSLPVDAQRFFVEYYHRQILDAAVEAGSRIGRAIPRPSWREKFENGLQWAFDRFREKPR
jgi:hypothetical protein